MMTNQPIL